MARRAPASSPSPSRLAARFAGAVGGACALAVAVPAAAYEDQLTIEGGVGYAHAFRSDVPSGASFGLAASVGLDDVWTIKATFAYGVHPAGPAQHVFVGGAELIYVVDVLEIVPYFGAGLDALGAVRGADRSLDLAAHLVFGADYLLSRSVFVGVEVRPHLLVTQLAANDERAPLYVTALARVGLVFDL